MAVGRKLPGCGRLVLLCLLGGLLLEAWAGKTRYSVPEETDKGSLVGNIAKDLGIQPQELAERGVRIVSRGKTQFFALNPRSGTLVTAGRIDREELCAQSARCLVNFNILLKDQMKLFPVEVEIIDINDNTPQFQIEELEVKMNEITTVGTRIPLPSGQDLDVGMNSLQSYQLSINPHFSLDVQQGADGPQNPEMVLQSLLDREEATAHHLILTASDGGDPVRSGTLQIRVLVVDANDNPPSFTQAQYHISVPENVPLGTRLLVVNATDPDEGANGKVTYSFHNIDHRVAQVFQLDSDTGEIVNKEPLDFEEYETYSMEVQAQDGAGLMARAKVLIKVLDVNDNVPEMTVTSVTTAVPENFPPGIIIALINVYDQDSRDNGHTTCSIPGNLPFKLEKLVDNYYRLVTERTLDRELTSEYNITVTAADSGTPALSTETHISILVTDINDNPPTFSRESYSTYIPENNPRGASIFSLTAQDPDSNENARITYSLAEDTIQGAPLSSYFSINSDTGVLYALRSFDFEQFRDLQLWVTARDSGDPSLSSNVSLNLLVLDQNDNAPEILYPTLPTDGSTGVELAPRSAEPGYLVTKVVAVDRDSGQNAWLSYHLLKASEPGLFAVGVHTGEVRTARALQDRDALKQSLVVAVQDHGQPPLSATVTLTVAVADSIPDVLADLGSIKTPSDSDDSGLTLYLVVAVAVVSCVFLAFVIVLMALRLRRWHMSRLLQDRSRGLVDLPASHFVGVDGVRAFLQTYSHEVSLTEDSRKSHLIFPQLNYMDTLISHDSCEKKDFLSTPQSLLEDKKEMIPQQGEMSAGERLPRCRKLVVRALLWAALWEAAAAQMRYSVPEEVDKGAIVGNIAKHLGLEPQALAERGVRIVSRGKTQFFSLDLNSGSLITADRIDREELCAQRARCLVNFNILLEDTLSIYSVEVEVTDVNDNAPRFGVEELELKISETTTPGFRIPLKSAHDADVGENGLQKYQLNPNDHFSLNVRSGADGDRYPELVLQRALDREEEALHHLLLLAFDGGDPVQSGTSQIRVTVLDVNDNAPVFTEPEYRVSVPENMPIGTRVLAVTATDADEGFNAQVAYFQEKKPGENAEIFELKSTSGEIVIIQSLDYEDTKFHEIDIEAQDGPGLLTRTKVIVTVLDVNDNAPEFYMTSATSSVPEDSPPGAMIALFNVHDRDSGQNAFIECSLPEDLPFKLERSVDNYYRLVTTKPLDREQISSYNITVTAKDGGRPALSTEAHLLLQVADINDNPPAFPQASYSAYIPENNLRGTSIFTVMAYDPDSEDNAHVTYSLAEDTIQGPPVTSYVSINSDTGVLYALRSFDYEQFRELQLWVTAKDSGDPPLSSNVSLNLLVLDQNDNAPEILYPAFPTDGSTGVELAPCSAEPGYLVTKVVAVDRDSGQNAWLSYRLLKASEPGLFAVGVHTGEVRTARALQDRDVLKQSLVVAVQDHGQPPLSATVTLTVAVADSIPDVLADLGSLEPSHDSDASDLTLYLVVAVAVVSCIFLAFVIMLMTLRVHRWHKFRLLQTASRGLDGVPGTHFVGVDGVRAFLQTYSHEVSLTADSHKSHLIFPQPNYADTLISQDSCEKKDYLSGSQSLLEGKGEAISQS
ncbi:PREDICTED: protocadherin gamma-A1 [Elephantulus edwardii]|uniref:protocadherin gamma-A1 n=1 Tax=Elephantulus edwardii TaxID=28737 RepID=UPI0003F0D85B|nr:PREDICTED: protocadherin gamma-A1 [Elephantulus edwardii]